MVNNNLRAAKKAKNDEFYTQYPDIQKEIGAYLMYNPDTFRGKIVYCNCDDPFESNFFKYFVLNFERLGLKKLITTSYKPSPIANKEVQLSLDVFDGNNSTRVKKSEKGRPKITANKFIISDVGDIDGDGQFNLQDVALQLRDNKNNEWSPLEEDGDFRNAQCIELLKQADIVVTNPPFSLFRQYLKQLIEYNKKFIVIANKSLVTTKEVFPLFQENKIWSGTRGWGGGMWFETTNLDDVDKIIDGKNMKNTPSVWLTNIDHGRRHELLSLMTSNDNLKFNKKMKGTTEYQKYVNYDAIEVPFTDAIPCDYEGKMGVPISFLDKYNPDQFEIIGASLSLAKPISDFAPKGSYQQGGPRFYIANGDGTFKRKFDRVVIKAKKAVA